MRKRSASAAKAEACDVVLDRTSLEEMWREVVPVEEASALGPVGMGLSFFLYERGGHRVIGHTGSQKSFRAFIFLDPDADVAMIGTSSSPWMTWTRPSHACEVEDMDVEGDEASIERFGRFKICKDDQGSRFGLHQRPAVGKG